MKNFKPLIFFLIVIISFSPIAETKAQSVSISFSTFQQELSPYGRWMNNPRFGQVWINNDAGFKPYYTNGHWEYTNYGWSWESDYDWGWAPFHYGRWEHDQYYGWMWIPGYEWASAWVSWSSYDDYYGWAPLGYGNNINISFGSIPYERWNFIPRRNICDRDFYRHNVSHVRNNNFRNAVVINNYYNGRGGVGRYMRGPERREVERYTNNRVQERRIDYNDNYRNRNNRIQNRNNNAGNDNDRNGRRNNDGVNQNNNDNNPGTGMNRRNREVNNDNGGNRQGTRPGDANNNGANENNRRRRGEHTNADNNTIPPVFDNRRPQRDANSVPQTNENNNRRRQDANTTPPVYENRRPQRDVNTTPQTNENNNPGRRQNENRIDRSDNQQHQQQYEKPVPQQQMERPAPQQRMERQAPQQQTQPVPQQRSMERRADAGIGGNRQQPGGNGNGDWKSDRRKNGN